MSKYRNKKKVK